MPPVLGYWDIRGLGQPIRILLNYVGDEFENKFYVTGPAPDFNKDSWHKHKDPLKLAFPNLPYYIDGDIRITQSNAILRHIGRKHNLCGKTEAERVKVDILADQAMDFRNGLVGLIYNPAFADLYAPYMEQLKTKLKQFSDFLGDKKFFVSNEPTFVDFPMYELLDQHRIMDPKCLDDYKNLKAFLDRFESLGPVKKYMQSDKFMKAPINNRMALFGAK